MSLLQLAVKVTSFLTTAIAVNVSLSPPNPPVKDHNASVPKTFFEEFIQSITFFTKVAFSLLVLPLVDAHRNLVQSMAWLAVLWDLFTSITTFSLRKQHHIGIVRHICSNDPDALWTVHPLMIVGAGATVIAAMLRTWFASRYAEVSESFRLTEFFRVSRCFKTLGPLFTFEVTIRPKHELITSGPYAWVRHPSYTGIYGTLLGASAVLGAPGSWMMECGLFKSGSTFLLVLWLAKCLFVFKGMSVRLAVEDKILKGAFGERWEQYAKEVPKSLLPGVI